MSVLCRSLHIHMRQCILKNHSLSLSLAHSPTHSASRPIIHTLSLFLSLTHTRPLTHSSIHSHTHSLINSLTHTLSHSLTRPLTLSLSHALIQQRHSSSGVAVYCLVCGQRCKSISGMKTHLRIHSIGTESLSLSHSDSHSDSHSLSHPDSHTHTRDSATECETQTHTQSLQYSSREAEWIERLVMSPEAEVFDRSGVEVSKTNRAGE